MFKRHLEAFVRKLSQYYSVLCITGPRQSGKTTLAKMLFPSLPYVSLENIDIRTQAISDARAFLEKYSSGAIFDEVQHAPELLSYMQQMVDEDPSKARFVLTGSQNLSLTNQVSQSLAGRIGLSTLLPLSLTELAEVNQSVFMQIISGGYPKLHKELMSPDLFYPSYIQTYLERDIRQIKNVSDLFKFQAFMRLCAARVGQVLNLSSLAQDCGISHTTARQWISVLSASYVLFLLPPYHTNFNKRVTKMPKLYFYDTGLACSLLGLETESHLEKNYMLGALYENLVILEIMKARLNCGKDPQLYFWRDQAGEVDCLAEWGGELVSFEIKNNSTFKADHIKGLQYFKKISKNQKSYLIYNGEVDGEFLDINLLPLKKIQTILQF